MKEILPEQDLQNIILRPVYIRAVNSLVRPDKQIPCTLYFFKEWLPRLGSIRWLLVLALRYLCNSHQSDGINRGEVSRSQLSSILGVHEVTITRILSSTKSPTQKGWRILKPSSDDDIETKYLSKFIPKLKYKYEYDNNTGATRRMGYVIDVVMDDPLVPEDEHKLAIALAEQIIGSSPQEISTSEASKDNGYFHKYQNETSQHELKYQNVTSNYNTKYQNESSLQLHNKLIVTSPCVSYRNDTALTLTKNFNYNNILIPLTLTQNNDIRKALMPLVNLAQEQLQDNHSTGMFYSTLLQLYPENLEIFTQALEETITSVGINTQLNKGAIFVNQLKSITKQKGINIKLGKTSYLDKNNENTNIENQLDQKDYYQKIKLKNNYTKPTDKAVFTEKSFFIPEAGMTNHQLWSCILDELKSKISKQTNIVWLRNCYISQINIDSVIICSPNKFSRDWALDRLTEIVQKNLSKFIGRKVNIFFRTDTDKDTEG